MRICCLGSKRSLTNRPDVAKVLNLHVDPESYWIYTNTPSDNDRLTTIRRDRDLRQAVELLAVGH